MVAPPQAPERYISRQQRKRHLATEWARLAGLQPGMTVLDIGSGPGFLAAEYARLTGPDGIVYAVEQNVALAEPSPNLIPLHQDAAAPIKLPRPPDIVFITDTLHHAAAPLALLQSVRAACGENTKLLVTDYDPAQPGLVGAKPHRRMAQETAISLLQTAGFTILSAATAADEHYAILAGPTSEAPR